MSLLKFKDKRCLFTSCNLPNYPFFRNNKLPMTKLSSASAHTGAYRIDSIVRNLRPSNLAISNAVLAFHRPNTVRSGIIKINHRPLRIWVAEKLSLKFCVNLIDVIFSKN
jgi:hypothetical protein